MKGNLPELAYFQNLKMLAHFILRKQVQKPIKQPVDNLTWKG